MSTQVERMLPLYEAKMIGPYDHRAADVVTSATATKRQNQPSYLSAEAHESPDRMVMPKYWVRESVLPDDGADSRLAFLRISSPTNQRSMISALIPGVGVGDSVFLIEHSNPRTRALLAAQLNSFVVDFVVRQKLSGLNLNFFYVKQFPLLPPSMFSSPPAWRPDVHLGDWVLRIVRELTHTAHDMREFASAIGYTGPVSGWNEDRRAALRCELDAAMFHLFGVGRDEVEHIMETFPIVKRKDEAAYGEYRTKRLILDVYDQMAAAITTGTAYLGPFDEELA